MNCVPEIRKATGVCGINTGRNKRRRRALHTEAPSGCILCLGDISFVRFALRLRPVGTVRDTLTASGQQQNDSRKRIICLFEFLQKSGGKCFVALLRKMYAVIGQGNTPLSSVGKANPQVLCQSLT